MSELQNDQEIARTRKNPLRDNEDKGLQVTASLRDQQLEKLAQKLEDMKIGEKIINTWNRANADRTPWLERQNVFLQEIDEFIEPIYDSALDWSSTLHLPTILTVCKTYHARMLSALLSIDPPFVMRARQGALEDRAEAHESLMRYALKDWCNEYDGVEEVLDRWLWDWITKGVGYTKASWLKKFTRYMDVEVTEVQDVELETDPETGESVPVPKVRHIEKEVKRTEEVFNGPMLRRVPVEDLIIVGGEGDPNKADYVLEQFWMTSSELYSMVDQKIFRAGPVDLAIQAGKDYVLGSDQTNAIKQRQKEQAGQTMINREHELDRYRIIEAHLKLDVDGSGIASDVIVWVHWNTKEVLRATYLRRVMPTGQSPYSHIHFHLRHGTELPAGLVELLYSLGKEIDAMHNIKVDVGILSSLPFGFYRPTASALKEETMPVEPGALIPVDNPQTDVFFPNLGVRTSFGFQEEQALQTQVDRLASMSDMNYGILAGQGVARTATGARAVLGEASNNLSVFIQRMNRGWKRTLRYLWAMLQTRIPDGFEYRITGMDGRPRWEQVSSKEELRGMWDFELEGNSVNSNKQIQVEQANMVMQLTGNPLDIQLGLVTAAERYEALRKVLIANDIKDVGRFIRSPQQMTHRFAPIEIAGRVLAGIDVQLDPTQDLQGFVQLVQEFMQDDELNGQLNQHQIAALAHKAAEAQHLMAALKQQQAQQAAVQQQQLNAGPAQQQPSNFQPVNVFQQPGQGEGG